MGMPGYAYVTITTKVDFENQTASKEIKLGGRCGLNGLGIKIDLDRTLFRDLSMLPDGTYKIGVKERPENFLADKYFDYVWMPLGGDDESEV